MIRSACLYALTLSLFCFSAHNAYAARTILFKEDRLKLEVVAEGLHHPWGMVFLPDGRMLVTERIGRIRYVSMSGKVSAPIAGVPAVFDGWGGLLDVALDPHFSENSLIYFCYGEQQGANVSTVVAKARLADNSLNNMRVIFRQMPKAATNAQWSFGCRLVFAPDSTLFVTLGDNKQQIRQTQKLGNHLGKIVRITPNGGAPKNNPFAGNRSAKPEIWSYGHRNPQGAALHPETGELWISEHGPRGGDEINISLPGRNYGWPKSSYGTHYHFFPIADTHVQYGFEEPVHYWKDTVAPCGIAFYTGDKFPKWRGNLLVATLAGQRLIRLALKGRKIVAEERLLAKLEKRLRHVVQGPDGYVYVLTDEEDGQIIRLKPL